ncbi:MAG: ABC transporter permease [Planctomycetota bacterium]|jgi:ABC-type transport system involved in multi-copper enzyme maturation permease subunit
MAVALSNLFGRSLSLFRLTGPIFDKELRVSSRRRRNYVLRSVYLFFLMSLLLIVWINVIELGGSGLYLVSRMAEAGKTVIVCVVCFQFCVTQTLAVVMLSASISDEINSRTLGLLMTTPISGLQIVLGKLLSKLLQLILLLAISLPLLAIVRVFGGVPWDYVVSSLCITLSTVIFYGSLSLFFSIYARRAYVVIIVTVLALFVVLAALPYLTASLCFATTGDWPGRALTTAIFYHNPYAVLLFGSMQVIQPGGVGGPGWLTFYWPLHCGILMAASTLLLIVSAVVVRKVALSQATGQLGASSSKARSHMRGNRALAGRRDRSASPRGVIGPPVLWKELRFPRTGQLSAVTRLSITVTVIFISVSYFACSYVDALNDPDTHIMYGIAYLGLGAFFAIVVPSASVTSERESRSWPLLMATALDDWEILFSKFTGAAWRCLPVWLLLLGHTVVFVLAGTIHPVAIAHMAFLIFWVTFFLCGSGLYFSARCRRTTTAAILNLVLAITVWAIVPLLLFFLVDEDISEAYMDTNPVIHAGVIMDATAGRNPLSDYDWMGSGGGGTVGEATKWMLVCACAYGLVGLLFAWRAKCRLRRDIF